MYRRGARGYDGDIMERYSHIQTEDRDLYDALMGEEGRQAEGLELTPAARDHFANSGYDPVYGARPLKRLLQKEIETTLTRKSVAGEVSDGSRVVVDVGAGGQLDFQTTRLETSA